MGTIINPWVNLVQSNGQYFLASDLPQIQNFNKRANKDHYTRLDMIPEPRLGRIDAPVVILYSNPGLTQSPDPVMAQRLASLSNQYHPHVMLSINDPWWVQHYRSLIDQCGLDCVANNCLSIEYFPYRSKNWGHSKLVLPSQQYTVDLVNSALNRNATIILTRSVQEWYSLIPQLKSQLNNNVFETNSKQRAWISPGNLPTGVFDRICTAIREQCP